MLASSGAHASPAGPARLLPAPPHAAARVVGLPIARPPTHRHACHGLSLDTPTALRQTSNGRRRWRALNAACSGSDSSGERLSSAPNDRTPAADDAASLRQPTDGESNTGSDAAASASSNGAAAHASASSDAASNGGISGEGARDSEEESVNAAAPDGSAPHAVSEEQEWGRLDGNQLHTALSAAVNAEDYGRAQRESLISCFVITVIPVCWLRNMIAHPALARQDSNGSKLKEAAAKQFRAARCSGLARANMRPVSCLSIRNTVRGP